MAFKILDSNELFFLDDEQRIQYEKELELYQQRCAFVERLDVLENATIEPYEPKLEPITAINDIEVRPFEEIEYTISISEPIQKPDVKINTFEKIEIKSPVLPMRLAPATVQNRSIRKPERRQPVLPVIGNPYVEEKHFNNLQKQQPELPEISISLKITKTYQRIEKQHSKLPEVSKPLINTRTYHQTEKQQSKLPVIASPSIKKNIPFVSLENNQRHIPSNIPHVMMLDMNRNPVVIPEKQQPELPEVSVRAIEMRVYSKPQRHNAELPTAVQSNINVFYKGMKTAQPVLPEVSAMLFLTKSEFHKHEQKNMDLPTVAEPNINVRIFKKAEQAIPNLPGLSVVNMQPKRYSKPEYTKTNPPIVSLVQIGTAFFKKPESQKYHLPDVVEAGVEEKKFEKPEKVQLNVAVPLMPSIAVKTFKRKEQDIPELPKIKIGGAPDAYSALQKALSV